MFRKVGVRFGRVFGLSFLFIVSQQTVAPQAHAWGLLASLNTAWVNAALVNRVIQHREIDYCIEIQDPRFVASSIQTQAEAALHLWLKPLEPMGIEGVVIRQVDCGNRAMNLKIQFGPEKLYPTLASYQLPQYDNGHFYTLVKFNSQYVYIESNGTHDSMVDFENYVPNGTSLESELGLISLLQPTTVLALSASRSLDYFAVYNTTYRALIHELGHSFGLCDTYAEQIHVNCDPARMSVEQPSSVMHDSTYFYLMPDDLAGLKVLFTRFMK